MDRCMVCGAAMAYGQTVCTHCGNSIAYGGAYPYGYGQVPPAQYAVAPAQSAPPAPYSPSYNGYGGYAPAVQYPTWNSQVFSLPAIPAPVIVSEKEKEPQLEVFSPKEYLQFLLTGLLPFMGIFIVFPWVFSGKEPAEKRNLGKAMLWLHAGALIGLLCGLCLWVILLAQNSLAPGL